MTGAKSLSPFSYDWVGGDIWGLQRLEDECGRVAARLTDVDRALSRQVASVVGAGGWTGRAADAFTNAWDSDSKAGAQLAEAWDKIGEITGTLAAGLAALENALEEAAYQLEKQGIAVDTATGTPMPDVTAAGDTCPSPGTAVARGKLASDYMAYRADLLNKAAHARIHAAYALYAVTSDMLPPATDWGQLANDLDGVRGLWATPTTYRRELEEDFSKASIKQAGIIDEQWRAAIDGRKVNGDNFRMERDLVDRANETRQEVADLQGKLSGSPPESTLTMAADGDAEGLGLTGIAGSAFRAIPFVGTVAGAGLQIYQDKESHESWRHAIVDGVTSNGAALGAGAFGVEIIGGSSFVAVGAGVIAGTAAAVGVGTAVHNLIQENWTADWHQHGVLDGTVHGVADSFDKTRHDLAHDLDDLNPF